MPLTPAQVACERLFTAAAKSGVALLDHDKDQILGVVDQFVDTWQDKAIDAIAHNLAAGGVKDIEWGPIKGALLASETELAQNTNDRIAEGFDRIVDVLKAAAARAQI